MSEKHTATNWDKLEKMSDEEIDYSDIPALDESFFNHATVRMPVKKKAISLRVDEDVLAWYRKQGKGYQTKMNAILRLGMEASLTIPDDGKVVEI